MHQLTTSLAVALALFGAALAHAQDRPRVVTVNYPLQYLAEALLGDAAEVDFPVPADVDPSFWRPAIADISAIQSADLIVLNGAAFATWVDRVTLPRSKVVNSTAAISDRFIVTESITHSHGAGDEHSHEGLASYTWLDPTLAIAQAEAIAAAITARGLAPQTDVADRLAALTSRLSALDAQASAGLAGLADVTMIATHPRYQYFARRYGLTIDALEWEAGATPTDAELADLQAMIAETGATVLIWEGEPDPAAFAATAALGLRNVVFPTLAHGIEDQSFADVMGAAIAALADIPVE
ncbi:metal ABC transporter substrate-binding protein [Yoonia sp.]|uniref:metal ABC transporter substrate-binding protein n=1 Tax=Yoonia sp. TaxID=2212373 RepID=UPI002FD88DAE